MSDECQFSGRPIPHPTPSQVEQGKKGRCNLPELSMGILAYACACETHEHHSSQARSANIGGALSMRMPMGPDSRPVLVPGVRLALSWRLHLCPYCGPGPEMEEVEAGGTQKCNAQGTPGVLNCAMRPERRG